MRLWSIHPKYLDPAGLNACWREGLLAKHVLEGKTKGYTNHPQLERFKNTDNPLLYINAYLTSIYEEALSRGYSYNPEKIKIIKSDIKLSVTNSQVIYEKKHLDEKLKTRNPDYLEKENKSDSNDILLHPLFYIINGEIEKWEVIR